MIVTMSRVVESQVGPGVMYGDATGGFGGAAPKKFFAAMPFSLSANRGNALLRQITLKMRKHSAKRLYKRFCL